MQPQRENRTAKLTRCALCAATMALCAWITLPSAVPITMQTFALFLILLLFEGKTAAAAVTVYLLLGSIGLPVFSGMQGGIGVLLGPTGGFLIGFLLMALLDWCISLICRRRPLPVKLCCIALGLMLCYLTGAAWYRHITATDSFLTALGVCVLPALPADVIKLLLAAIICRPMRRRLYYSK